MAWSNPQKSVAAQACKAAGIDDDTRRLILRQFENSMYDAEGKKSTEPSSRSKRLDNADFENFMAIVERHTGGKLPQYERGHWQSKADDYLSRMRFGANTIAKALTDAGIFSADGAQLAGWIEKRVSRGTKSAVDQLDFHELVALIAGLSSFCRQRGVTIA